MSQKYEIMVIMDGQKTDGEIEKSLAGIKELLGEVVYEEIWGMRPFAYQINGQDKGYYAIWNFVADIPQVKALEEALKLYPNLVRHLIMKVPDNYTPVKQADVDAGIAEITKEKTERRGQVRTASTKREDDAKKPKVAVPDKPNAKPAAAAPKKEEKPAEKTEAEKEKEKADEKKSLDEKLEALINDDADLGL
ncbi:MAG: 30S ribosomal protein S6 [Candidatus Gracilibacteria bacterium]|nr:30S ribosomal protein S6 [Candidatus Gracilibacteria bacterium]